jgi:hypothetical protein
MEIMHQQKLEEENKKLQECIKALIESYNKIYVPHEIPPDENEIKDDLSKLDGE